MVQEMKGPMEKCHSRKLDLVKIPRKIGQNPNLWKKVSYMSEDEEDPNKTTMTYRSKCEEDRKKLIFSYKFQDEKDPKKVTVSYGSQVIEDPKNIKVSYMSEDEEDPKKTTLSYRSKDEENLKKTTLSYMSNDEEDPKNTEVSYMSEDEEDPKKTTMTYKFKDEEDPKNIKVTYISEDEEDPKKTTMTYISKDEENPKNIKVSYMSEDAEDPKKTTMTYKSKDEEDPNKTTLSYKSRDRKDPKKVTMSYGSQGIEDPKNIKKSYMSEDEEDPKKTTMAYKSNGEEDPKNIKVSYMFEDVEDPKKTTMTYMSKNEEDPKKVTLSYKSQDGKDPKKVTLSYGSRVDEPSKGDRHAHIHSDNTRRNMLADVFFFHDILRQGSVITPTIPPTTSLPALLPRHIADSLPFSTDRFADIIAMFKPASLGMASEIRWTLDTCKNPRPLPGEKAGCASSLESLIDLSMALLRTRNVQAFSADMPADPTGTPARRGMYKITAVRKLSESPEIATCHDLTYPYAVFFCHTTNSAVTYAVTLEAAVEGTAPSAMEVVAVCHLDTSLWSQKHPFFVVHNLKPGDTAACHFLSKLSIVWVPADAKQGGASEAQ
ncbi:hypothetical protein QOZ80_6BG0470490 [Eleusine coracana subsp. coracana]|nr:hypothetical protein QOZ80_6BG0470490 [Eleusine coracana subsp. coracana]